mgnify:FL=1
MANIKSIKDTGFLGSRKAIGTLRFMKAIDTPKVESKADKNNKSKVTNTTDYGFYKAVEIKDGDKVISSKWVLRFGIEVNGSLTYFQTQSEDFVKSGMKKKLRLRKEGSDTTTEKEVSLDEAKTYWKDAQNSIGFGLLSLDELKELGVELQEDGKNWLKFVTNKDFVQFMKIDQKCVELIL